MKSYRLKTALKPVSNRNDIKEVYAGRRGEESSLLEVNIPKSSHRRRNGVFQPRKRPLAAHKRPLAAKRSMILMDFQMFLMFCCGDVMDER